MITTGGETIFRIALVQIEMLVVGAPVFVALIFWIGMPRKSNYRVGLALG